MDYRKLSLEDLDIDDYKVIIAALSYFSDELFYLEVEDWYYEELISKLKRNLDIMQYNEKFIE